MSQSTSPILYFQFAHGTSALQAGTYLLPFVASFVASILANAIIMTKTGYYTPWYLFGILLSVAGGAVLYAMISPDSVPAQTYGADTVLAIEGGAYNQAAYSIAQAKAFQALLWQAVRFIICAQIIGITFVLGISNTVFLNRATEMVAEVIPDASRAEIQAAVIGINGAFLGGLGEVERRGVLEAIVKAVNETCLMVVAAGCVVVLLSRFMKWERLFQERTNETIPKLDAVQKGRLAGLMQYFHPPVDYFEWVLNGFYAAPCSQPPRRS